MSDGRNELRRADAERLAMALVAVPPRRIIEARPAIDDLIGALIAPQPVEVVRPADLVHLTFSFVNMQFGAGATPQHPPLLTRRTRSRAAFLVVDCHPQHVTEGALFEVAPKFPVADPPPPLHLGNGRRAAEGSRCRGEGIRSHQPRGPRRAPGAAAVVERRGVEPARVPRHQRVVALFGGGIARGDERARSQRRPPRRAARAPAPPELGRVLRQRSRRHHERARRRERARVPYDSAPAGRSTHPTSQPMSPRS